MSTPANPASSHADRSGRPSPGMITLVGAGELMPAMSALHRQVLTHVPGRRRVVFLDTTAGYETNVEAITAKAVEYFRLRLQLSLGVASYPHRASASDAETSRAIAEVRAADLLFAGPGSPTYALDQWRDSPLWEAVVAAFLAGAHLLFASAASITLGRYALPVYEIFKAGRDPHWADGLDLLGALGLNIAVVPHFNDGSGGDNYDSRYCYMGARRFEALQELLPGDVTILGIDEYTAVRLDPATRTATVAGQGRLTILADGATTTHESGSIIPFEALRSSHRRVQRIHQDDPRTYGYEHADTSTAGADRGDTRDSGDRRDPVGDLRGFIAGLPDIHQANRIELLARLDTMLDVAAGASTTEATLLAVLMDLRQRARQARDWAAADWIRDRLLVIGYEIGDTPDGSTWRRT